MAFIFTVRSTPPPTRHGRTGSMHHHRAPSGGSTLPRISEDGSDTTTVPTVPVRAINRPRHKIFGLGNSPRYQDEGSPPEYNYLEWMDWHGPRDPNGEKLAAMRNNGKNHKHIAKRGGWKRVAIIGALVLCIVVALVVGLVVGLRKKHS